MTKDRGEELRGQGGLIVIKGPVIPLNKKMVPAFFSFLVMALLDWSDGSIILFLGMAVVTNWVYQHDVPNLVVDKMIQMIIKTKNKITEALKGIVENVDIVKLEEH